MANVNTIAGMQKIAVKPMAWRVIQNAGGEWWLEFTYVQPGREPWCPVQSARGPRKTYKTADAALRDVARVQAEAVIYAHLLADMGQLSL